MACIPRYYVLDEKKNNLFREPWDGLGCRCSPDVSSNEMACHGEKVINVGAGISAFKRCVIRALIRERRYARNEQRYKLARQSIRTFVYFSTFDGLETGGFRSAKTRYRNHEVLGLLGFERFANSFRSACSDVLFYFAKRGLVEAGDASRFSRAFTNYTRAYLYYSVARRIREYLIIARREQHPNFTNWKLGKPWQLPEKFRSLLDAKHGLVVIMAPRVRYTANSLAGKQRRVCNDVSYA